MNKQNSNISAVIYSCTTTIGKLTSLVLSSGGESKNDVYNIRRDFEDENIQYKLQVVSEENPELLTDGLFVFHNPYAENPLDIKCFENTNATQFFCNDKMIKYTSNTYPIVARLNIPKVLRVEFGLIIQENLREYNNTSIEDIYELTAMNNEGIDFNYWCSVCMLAKNSTSNDVFIFHYERPQYITDAELTYEALSNFKDMQKKGIENNVELISIYIARTQEQYEYITNEIQLD